MPAGCEFICQNRSCEHYGKGFNITAPWPMGKIESVLEASNVKKHPEFRKKMVQLRDEGRKYACITFPNVDLIPIVAYRINMWSPGNSTLYQFDVEVEEDKSRKELIGQSDIPSVCPKTGGELWDFNEVTENGIVCPYCGIPLRQNRWFTNEEGDENDY